MNKLIKHLSKHKTTHTFFLTCLSLTFYILLFNQVAVANQGFRYRLYKNSELYKMVHKPSKTTTEADKSDKKSKTSKSGQTQELQEKERKQPVRNNSISQ